MRRASAAAALGAILLAQWVAVFALAGGVRLDADVVLLLPVALSSVYGIGALLSGPRLGLFAAGLWAFAPFVLFPLFDERYRDIYERDFLEPATGLTGAAEFRAAVALLVSTLLTARAIRTGGWVWGALAGAAAAVGCAVDPSATLFLPAPLIALAVARRWLSAVPLAGGLAIGLALAGLPSAPGDLGNLDTNQDGIREFFWSVRVLEWLPLAGVLGVARRSPPVAALLGSGSARTSSSAARILRSRSAPAPSSARSCRPGPPTFSLPPRSRYSRPRCPRCADAPARRCGRPHPKTPTRHPRHSCDTPL